MWKWLRKTGSYQTESTPAVFSASMTVTFHFVVFVWLLLIEHWQGQMDMFHA